MNKKEKVIFLTDVKGVAKKGEVREVEGAFAKNFLLPEQRALIYSKTISRQLQREKAELEKQQALKRNEEERTLANIMGRKLTFFLKEKDGQTFGSITALDIVRILKEKFSVQISRDRLPNFRPLREKGEFSIEVKIGKNLTTKLQVTVSGIQGNSKIQ